MGGQAGRIQPSHLGGARTVPAQSHVNYSATACSDLDEEKEGNVGRRRPEVVRVCGHARDVWLVAQEASTEVTVADGRWQRKQRRRRKREELQRETFTVVTL